MLFEAPPIQIVDLYNQDNTHGKDDASRTDGTRLFNDILTSK